MAFGPPVFVIEEFTGSDRRRVEFAGPDAPHGAPRERAGWEEGVEINRTVTYYVGNRAPTYHVKQAVWPARTIEGQFRDHLWGVPGHARLMRDRLIEVALRARIVRCTWGGESFTGLMQKPRFPVEGEYDITYSITFDVATVSGFEPADEEQRRLTLRARADSDMIATLASASAQLSVQVFSLALNSGVA